MMTLDELLNHAAGFAALAFQRTGEVSPMWIAEDAAGERMAIASPFESGADKDIVAAAMRQMFRLKNIKQYAFICEAWMAGTDNATKNQLDNVTQGNLRVSELPNRIEVIWVIAENKETGLSGQFVISRDSNGKPSLSEFKKFPSDGSLEGRFAGLLRDDDDEPQEKRKLN